MYSPIFPRLVPVRDSDLIEFLCMKGHIRYCSWSSVLGVNLDTRDLHAEDGMDSFYFEYDGIVLRTGIEYLRGRELGWGQCLGGTNIYVPRKLSHSSHNTVYFEHFSALFDFNVC
jgi:hypothetical protein